MFVSSVDVEEGMAVSRKKKKNTSREWEEYQEQDGKVLEAEEGWLDPESFYADSQPVPRNNEFQSNGIDRELSYATTERAWSSYRKVDRWEMLSAGCVVGWWALGINPTTYSPENLLTLARLISISQPDDKVVVQPIPRPGTSTISFGKLLEDTGVAEGEEEAEEESFAWKDIVNGEWRLVQSGH